MNVVAGLQVIQTRTFFAPINTQILCQAISTCILGVRALFFDLHHGAKSECYLQRHASSVLGWSFRWREDEVPGSTSSSPEVADKEVSGCCTSLLPDDIAMSAKTSLFITFDI